MLGTICFQLTSRSGGVWAWRTQENRRSAAIAGPRRKLGGFVDAETQRRRENLVLSSSGFLCTHASAWVPAASLRRKNLFITNYPLSHARPQTPQYDPAA